MKNYLLTLMPTLILTANINGIENINQNTINIEKTVGKLDITEDFKKYFEELNNKSSDEYMDLYNKKLLLIKKKS